MAWEHIDKIFPLGFMVDPDNNILTNQDIINNNFPVVTSIMYGYARKMVYKQEEWGWGQNGEFGIVTQYDVENTVPHVDNISPFNTYGQTMLYDYLTLNNIDAEALQEPFI